MARKGEVQAWRGDTETHTAIATIAYAPEIDQREVYA
jgi:hypothetical protein